MPRLAVLKHRVAVGSRLAAIYQRLRLGPRLAFSRNTDRNTRHRTKHSSGFIAE
jgi:hypothetical protein